MATVNNDHGRLDERSLALHTVFARKMLENPALLAKAQGKVRRLQAIASSPLPALAEWEQVLSGPDAKIAQFLTECSDGAKRLRQSSLFAGILTEIARLAIYESLAIGTYHSHRISNPAPADDIDTGTQSDLVVLSPWPSVSLVCPPC